MNEQAFFDIVLHDLAPVGAVMLLGLAGGKLARLARLPKVTGYLVIGIIIGPSVLGLISLEVVASLSLVNDIALGLIMFAIGGVFEIHHIRRVGQKIFWLTLAQSLAVVGLVGGGVYLAGMDSYPSLVLGMIAIATAPAATLLVIREFGAQGEFTDTLITVTATTNIVCILGFEFALAVGGIAVGENWVNALLRPLFELGGSLVIGLVVGFIISKWEEHVEDQAELLMIIVAGIMLTVGLAMTLNLQPLFATLILGAITTNLSMMHRLVYVEIRQIEQPLYIAFFVLAGASLHLDLIPALGTVGIVFFVMRVVAKIFGTYIVGRWRGMPKSINRYLGLGMIAQAGVAIGLIDYANRTDPQLGAILTPIVLATVLLFETVGPPVIEWVLLKAGDIKTSAIRSDQ
ncbi:MAG: cation:proton antiporter [candidate division Zixibacteria bacterium]